VSGAEREAWRRTGVSEQQWRASVAPYIDQLLASGRYPNLGRLVTSGGDEDEAAAFEFILGFLLDGLGALLAAQRFTRLERKK
jgi:hypothetical protein